MLPVPSSRRTALTPDDPFIRERTTVVRLRDGLTVRVRPVVAGDRAALEAGFRHLSDRSRAARFLAPKATLTEAELGYLTDVDYVDHFAWAAIDLDATEQRGVGVSRWVRLGQRPDAAEAAVVVLDDYQGRGIGTLLLGAVAESARAAGIGLIVADFLPANRAVSDIVAATGARADVVDGMLHVEVELPPVYPSDHTALQTVLRTAAQGQIAPAVREARLGEN